MAITMQRLADATATIEVEWYGEKAEVRVRPGRINRALFDAVYKTEGVDGLTEQVMAVVEAWDVLGDDGKPLPVTEEVLRDIPLGFIRAILEATVASISDQG